MGADTRLRALTGTERRGQGLQRHPDALVCLLPDVGVVLRLLLCRLLLGDHALLLRALLLRGHELCLRRHRLLLRAFGRCGGRTARGLLRREDLGEPLTCDVPGHDDRDQLLIATGDRGDGVASILLVRFCRRAARGCRTCRGSWFECWSDRDADDESDDSQDGRPPSRRTGTQIIVRGFVEADGDVRCVDEQARSPMRTVQPLHQSK